MTYEEAVEWFESVTPYYDEEEAIEIAIKCIKKQMPKPKRITDLNGKCGSCKWATPNETHFGCSPCYIICKKPGKVFRTSIAHVKQRTNKACKGYERAEDEESKETEKA